MALSDKDKKDLAEALMKLSPAELDRLHDRLKETKRSLEDANSAFPETQSFLRQRGLTNVSQLDAQGLEDLRMHLEQVLAKLGS